jgi:hypothetical protein
MASLLFHKPHAGPSPVKMETQQPQATCEQQPALLMSLAIASAHTDVCLCRATCTCMIVGHVACCNVHRLSLLVWCPWRTFENMQPVGSSVACDQLPVLLALLRVVQQRSGRQHSTCMALPTTAVMSQ